MLFGHQYVKVQWNKRTCEHYISLGYKFTRFGDYFWAKAEDLTQKSHHKIKVICDYCGEPYIVSNDNYNKYKQKANCKKDACNKCKNKKSKETMIELYGVEFPVQYSEFKKKMEETNLEIYGNKCVLGNKEIQEKIENTNMERYGVKKAGASKDIQRKIQNTCLKRFGAISSLGNKDVQKKANETRLKKFGTCQIMDLQEYRDKAKETCVRLYGGESSQSSPEIRKKSMETLMKNGTMPRSRAEIQMVEIIKEIYGKDACVEQYPFDRCSFDCLLTIGDIKIDIEYDGNFWHNEEKDNRRDWYNIRRGFKVLRFKSDLNVPTKEQITSNIGYLVNSRCNRKIVNI